MYNIIKEVSNSENSESLFAAALTVIDVSHYMNLIAATPLVVQKTEQSILMVCKDVVPTVVQFLHHNLYKIRTESLDVFYYADRSTFEVRGECDDYRRFRKLITFGLEVLEGQHRPVLNKLFSELTSTKPLFEDETECQQRFFLALLMLKARIPV